MVERRLVLHGVANRLPFPAPCGAFSRESGESGVHSEIATGFFEGGGRKSRAITVAWKQGP